MPRKKRSMPIERYAFSESEKIAIEQQGYKAVAKLRIESEGLKGWILKLKENDHASGNGTKRRR